MAWLRHDDGMHPDPRARQYVFVQRPEGVTSKTAKAMFWIILLGVGVPMLLCVIGCFAVLVLGAADSGGAP